MANHESRRTTGLYDRRGDEITLDEVSSELNFGLWIPEFSNESTTRLKSQHLGARRLAVNARIKVLSANPEEDNAWWVQVLVLFPFRYFRNICRSKAYENRRPGDNVALLAWRAMNLLELSAWSIYCTKNRDNSRRVYEDAGRDAREVFDVFLKWGAPLEFGTRRHR